MDLIDLICAAMLVRIRWTCKTPLEPPFYLVSPRELTQATVLDADYSVALQLLLKYPSPQEPHGPHTFVDDAIYLRDHLNAAGGSAIILKYTGKAPAALPSTSRPSTPTFQGFNLRHRTLGARSPLSTPARLLQQPGGVEALFQGAAKGVIERGERLGINQAVRDAMGEIRRNVQGLNDTRNSARPGRGAFADGSPMPLAVAAMERRNRQLAAMLDEAVTDLKVIATSDTGGDGDRDRYLEMIDLAAAKIQLVKLHLEDSSLALPEDDLPALNTLAISPHTERKSPTVALDTTPVVMTSSAVGSATSTLSSADSAAQYDGTPQPTTVEDMPPRFPPPITSPTENTSLEIPPPEDSDRMDTDFPEPQPGPDTTNNTSAETEAKAPPNPTAAVTNERPARPIPTRSSLAQSSFSWMLEPDDTITTLTASASQPSSHSSSTGHQLPHFSTGRPASNNGGARKAPPNHTNSNSRERNAFLFGEVTSSDAGGRAGGLAADEIFGLLPMRKGKGRPGRGL